jgi:hypothetical protein
MSKELLIHPVMLRKSLDSPEGRFDLFYEVAGAKVALSATPLAAMCLPIAMSRGWALRSIAPVSALLLRSFETIQNIYRFFLPGSQRIQIEVPVCEEPAAPGREAASFFSGGVDSYYTYLKNRNSITRLIFVSGLDIMLSQTSFANLVLGQIRTMADELGVGLIHVKTNVRELSDSLVPWSIYHGAVLGGIASLLAPELNNVFIASSHNYADMFPWGSHPLLDPYWSTEAVKVQNDGCEAERLKKLQLVVQSDVAMRHLRVCYNNKLDRYNCNRCEKCLRTKVALYALGALDRCQTLDDRLDLNRIKSLRYGNNGNVLRANMENYRYLRRHRPHPALERAMRLASRRPSWLTIAGKQVRRLLKKKPAVKAFET